MLLSARPCPNEMSYILSIVGKLLKLEQSKGLISKIIYT